MIYTSFVKNLELNYNTSINFDESGILLKIESAPQLYLPRKTYTTIRSEELFERKLIVSRTKTPILTEVCTVVEVLP